MKNLFLLNNTYVRQRGPDDCGIACTAMLLNYAGRYDDGFQLLMSGNAPAGGLSLFDLRELGSQFGLRSKCVQLEIETLRGLASPCILHTINPEGLFHFVISFGAKKSRGHWKYLIGDPATGLGWLRENELVPIWAGRNALYVEYLRFGPGRLKDHCWHALLTAPSLQKTLLLSIPVINLGVTLLGVALSWLLQRGINDSLSDKKPALLIAIVALLCLIMLGKSLGSYLRQQILVKLNSDIRQKYYNLFIERFSDRLKDESAVRSKLADVQRIQDAFSAMLGILFSEGALVTLLLTGLWYYEPMVALIVTAYVILLLAIGIRNSAGFSAKQAALTASGTANEKSLTNAILNGQGGGERMKLQLQQQLKYTGSARSLAASVNGYNLLYECCGISAVICVLTECLFSLRNGQISYNMLMTEVIVSFFITVLTPRICHAFPVITAGGRLIRQFEN